MPYATAKIPRSCSNRLVTGLFDRGDDCRVIEVVTRDPNELGVEVDFDRVDTGDGADFGSDRSAASSLPLFLFVILFGISMDYRVFILSRVKELVDGGMETGEAVATLSPAKRKWGEHRLGAQLGTSSAVDRTPWQGRCLPAVAGKRQQKRPLCRALLWAVLGSNQ